MAYSRTRRDDPAHHGVATTTVEIIKEYVGLLVTEFRLLKAELSEKVGQIGLGVALAIAGTALLIVAIALLVVVAISALVDAGLGLTVATLSVFGFVLVIGLACEWVGLRQLQPRNLLPKKTIEQVQKDFEAIAPGAD